MSLYNRPMVDHIGIVACSAEGAALCYRTLCIEGAQLLGPHAHPEVSMHTHSLGDYMECVYRDDWQGVGTLMLSSAHKLAKIGANFLICPDNTIHQALPYVESRSPLDGCTSRMSLPTPPSAADFVDSACWEHAGSSIATSIRKSSQHAHSTTGVQTRKSVTKSTASSWTSSFMASSSPKAWHTISA
jgi:hypothetical protein